MRKLFTVLLFLVFANSTFAGWGFWDATRSYIQIHFRTTETWYTVYNAGASTYNAANLGTLTADSDVLKISAWDVKTWENSGDDVTAARIYWRIYKDGTVPGSYTSSASTYTDLSLGGGNEKRGSAENNSSDDINIDVSGLEAGAKYWLSVYIEAENNGGTKITDPATGGGTPYSAYFTTDAAFPVELSSFTANLSNNTVNLNWATATEINNYGFEIEKSVDKDNWNKIAFVNGRGNSNNVNYYAYADKNVTSGNNYYRLKQLDNDGAFVYSSIVEVNVNAPAKFELAQNYPNPFNPATKISYSIPEASNVKLTIYNTIGQVVRSINEGYKEMGSYTVEFNGRDLNSGIYFYKLEAGKNSQIRKMIMVK